MDFRKVVREWKEGPDRGDTGVLVRMLEREFGGRGSSSSASCLGTVIELFPRSRMSPLRPQREF